MSNKIVPPKRVLVTGGAGFLGSYLCERLLENGCHVLCIDNLQTGSKENISHLFSNPLFEFLLHDVVNSLNVDVDEIYNLACPASPVQYQCDPVRTLRTAVIGTMNLLELAKQLDCKILQASTSEVYGDPEVHPQSENYWGNVNPIGFRSCYDEGKRCAETLCFDYNRQHNTKIKVARIFNTYGPRMSADDGRVVSNFIVQGLTGREMTVYGSGLQTRAFCFVNDMIEGLISLMGTDSNVTGPINLGNPSEVSVADLARIVKQRIGSSSEITYRETPMDDPTRRCPDISVAEETLSWKPTVSLEDGLDITIAHFRNRLKNVLNG